MKARLLGSWLSGVKLGELKILVLSLCVAVGGCWGGFLVFIIDNPRLLLVSR